MFLVNSFPGDGVCPYGPPGRQMNKSLIEKEKWKWARSRSKQARAVWAMTEIRFWWLSEALASFISYR